MSSSLSSMDKLQYDQYKIEMENNNNIVISCNIYLLLGYEMNKNLEHKSWTCWTAYNINNNHNFNLALETDISLGPYFVQIQLLRIVIPFSFSVLFYISFPYYYYYQILPQKCSAEVLLRHCVVRTINIHYIDISLGTSTYYTYRCFTDIPFQIHRH